MSRGLWSDDRRHILRHAIRDPEISVDTETGPTDTRFAPAIDDETLQKERRIARALRATAWWRKKRASGLCHYCGSRFKPADLTMDHLVPLVRGGRSARANLVPCCKPCNNDKKNLLTIEWRPTDPPPP